MALPETPASSGGIQSPTLDPGPLERLSRHFQSSPDIYFETLLNELLTLQGVLAGQVWGLNQLGQLARISTTDIERFHAFEHSAVVDQHRDLISRSLFSGKRLSADFQETGEYSPLGRRLNFLPLHLGTESIGVVELIQESSIEQKDEQILERLISGSSHYLAAQSNSSTKSSAPASVQSTTNHGQRVAYSVDETTLPEMEDSNPKPQNELNGVQSATNVTSAVDADGSSDADEQPHQISSSDVESFVLLLHNQNDLPYVAATAITETRRLINCDRISLAMMIDGATEMTSISGQDSIARKSNIIRAMQKLATQVIKSGQELCFEVGDDPDSSELVAEYLGESGARWVKVIPLFAPEKIDFESNIHRSDQVPFGALILELFSDRPTPCIQDIQRLTPHIAQATFFALAQEQIFLLPLRRRIGTWATKSKLTRSKLTWAILLAAIAMAALTFIEIPYHVRATGRLMPIQKFRAYAPFDGQVQRVWVESGQTVSQDEPLVTVFGETLASRDLTLQNNIFEKKKLLSAYKAQLDETSDQLSAAATISLNTKMVQLSLEIQGLDDQLQLVRRLLERSHIKSEIEGTIATFRPGDLLQNRPVRRGELLLEVMNEQGAWQLELELPEKRFGHLLDEIQSNRTGHRVTFVQATSPEQSLDATVEEVSTRVSVNVEGLPSILIHANINPEQSFRKTIGAEVIAQIQCGKRSLGYVWFGDIIDWTRQWF